MIDIHHNWVYKKAHTQLQNSLLGPTAASATAFLSLCATVGFLRSWTCEVCSHLSMFSAVVHYFACLSVSGHDKLAMGLL